MAEKQKNRMGGTLKANMVPITGSITITAAGAISAQSGERDCGVTFVKNATAGRYDGTVHKGYARVFEARANVTSPTAGDVPVVTDGNLAYVNGIAATKFAGTSPMSTFSIQCCTSNGVATAANPKSGDTVTWAIWVSETP